MHPGASDRPSRRLPALTLRPAQTYRPMSSLTWTLELLHEPENIGMEDFWQYQVATDYAAEGYGHSEARMWDKNGRLTLISRQTVTLFG
ncbi:hypothetical protein [Neisseria sp.]|uniref:hypothetical protein n=1 Tax=Neisseria sp. TaxID=192066 RepID=UPI0034C680B2